MEFPKFAVIEKLLNSRAFKQLIYKTFSFKTTIFNDNGKNHKIHTFIQHPLKTAKYAGHIYLSVINQNMTDTSVTQKLISKKVLRWLMAVAGCADVVDLQQQKGFFMFI